MEAGVHGSRRDEEEDDDDEVSLDASFFVNEKYGQLIKFRSSQLTRKPLRCTVCSLHLWQIRPPSRKPFPVAEEVSKLYQVLSNQSDYDLTGQLVWPGAELLAAYLLQNRALLHGSSVIELGAGLGLTGLLCARYCEHVVLTDYHDTVLKVMQMNVDHQISTLALQCPNMEMQQLEWGCENHLDSILNKHQGGFNLIMGADICYQQSFLTPLLITIHRLLKQERARAFALLAYVSRITSMDVAVIVEASKVNLQVNEVPGTRKKVAGGLYEGWIYQISLKATP